MTKRTIPEPLTPWLRDFASSSLDAELADLSIHAAARIEQLEAGIIAALRERDEHMRPILRAALHGEG